MLGENLNGLKLPSLPGEIGNALLPFRITEIYHNKKPGGGDLTPTYEIRVPSEYFTFSKLAEGYVMSVKPSAFQDLENKLRSKKPDDVMIYPAF